MSKTLVTRGERLRRITNHYQSLPDMHVAKARSRYVAGGGSEAPKVLFVGDIPGGDEAKTGNALEGRRKAFVLHLMRGIDLKEEHMHTTYLLKYRPTGGRDPKELETVAAMPLLLQEIDVLKPEVVITWGRYMLDQFAQGQKLQHVHGKHILSDHGFMFVPMFSPDAGLVNPGATQMLIQDFQTIRSLV